MIRTAIIDPSAFTPPYDHALCAALARQGADVELITSRFAYGAVPAPEGYQVKEAFYRHVPGEPGSRRRRIGKLVSHVPDMLALRRSLRHADIAHFQWLDVPWLDWGLLPSRPRVLTAHDLLPREPRPGQLAAQRRLLDAVDAVVVHSGYGRAQLIDGLGLASERVHVIPHGAFTHLTEVPPAPLPPELGDAPRRPVVLFFGLLRPYKGLAALLSAWRQVTGGELWIAGRAMMDTSALRAAAPASVRFVSRFVSDAEQAALFSAADVLVLPYLRTERFDQSGVLASALAFGKPVVLSAVGGFSELGPTGAVRLVAPGDAEELATAIQALIDDAGMRSRMAAAALAAAAGPLSWTHSAELTLALYRSLLPH